MARVFGEGPSMFVPHVIAAILFHRPDDVLSKPHPSTLVGDKPGNLLGIGKDHVGPVTHHASLD